MLKVENLTVEFSGKKILEDVTFEVHKNDWLMVVGPNGAGKSTIVNAVSKAVPYTGEIFLKGTNIRKLKSRDQAKIMGVLSQSHNVSYSFTVEDIVKLGRYASRGKFLDSSPGTNKEKVEKAIEITGLKGIRQQSVLTLSGGELQRTFLAQLFAQDPQVLLLDEPTNHLDLVYQKQIFSLVEAWIKENECCVISIVHDLSLAKKYGNKAMLLNQGKIIEIGETSDVFCRKALKDVYDMDVYDWMNDLAEVWQD